MFKRLKNFTLQMLVGANVVTIIMMLFVGFADWIPPVRMPSLSNLGLVFPGFVLVNAAFLVVWLLVHRKGMLIPLAGFLLAIVPIRQYCPLNIPAEPPGDAIKVLSYNVWLYAGWETGKGEVNPILKYIRDQNADIVCLQEAATNEVKQERIDSMLNPVYQYRDTVHSAHGDVLALFSKYPLLSRETIRIDSAKVSAVFHLDIDGEETLVINNHFQSTGLTKEEKAGFKAMMKGELEQDSSRETSKNLLHTLGVATATRSVQAEAVDKYIREHRTAPIILCGDFNDGPISYARRTVAKNLTDCYVSSGNGPGISYHVGGFLVRIDHVMCSDHFTPYACKVDRNISTSDHYPVLCWLKKRTKSR